MQQAAANYIQTFQMLPHPEGGYYKETFHSEEIIDVKGLPSRFSSGRKMYSSIYFLLESGDFSAFHRLKSDECWHFYAGGCLQIHMIYPSGFLRTITLGNEPGKREMFQVLVPALCWFAAAPVAGSVFSFTGCTMAPGFDFEDFELADRKQLIALYPQHEELILRFTR